jgi:xylono-1,5-lactonase
MSQSPPVEVACVVRATLGEGPVWDAAAGVLWFVDIKQRQVHRFTPSTERLDSWTAPDQVGWIFPMAGGGYLCGLKTGLFRFDPTTGVFDLLTEVEPELPGNRLNDATVDRFGRVWFGSMDDGESAPSGHFYRADANGVARVLSGVSITNGPAVSPAGDLLYHTDTLARVISVSRIGADGALSDTRPFVQIDPADGYPDGPVVDADGCLWTALWGGWAARRYSPAGELLQTVRFPAANITKLAFGGPDGTTVYATSARKGLSEAELAAQPHAGDLFCFGAETPGLPAYKVTANLLR